MNAGRLGRVITSKKPLHSPCHDLIRTLLDVDFVARARVTELSQNLQKLGDHFFFANDSFGFSNTVIPCGTGTPVSLSSDTKESSVFG